MNKNDWHDDRVDVKKLNLDLQNPRIPKHVRELNDVVQIRNYLLAKEGVLRIARSIASNGYHKSAVAIVYEDNGELIVLDGNRRLAACQLLLDPKLAPTARDRKELEDLNKKLDKIELENVRITIAPSRKAAEKEIWDIHVNQLLKSWEVLQKLRMYRNLIDSGDYTVGSASSDYGITSVKFKRELAKLYFYEQILEQVDDKGEEELLASGFNKIDRLILSDNGRKLLNYAVEDNGSIKINNKKDFDIKFKKLIPYIVIPDKINAQVTQEALEKTVYSVIDPKIFPQYKTSNTKKTITNGIKSTSTKEDSKDLNIFVVMAFAGLDDVYNAIENVAKKLFKENAKVSRIDYVSGARKTQDQNIERALETNGLLIAVLSMGSKEKMAYDVIKKDEKAKEILQKFYPINHNVLLELGYGLKCVKVLGKDLFILVNDKVDGDLPTLRDFSSNGFFDIRNRGQIFYKDIPSLKSELEKNFKKNDSVKRYLKK